MVHTIAEADERSPFGRLTPDEFYARHGVTHTTSFVVNPRGLRIFTQSAVAVVHGFTGESSWMVQLTAVHLATAGFAVAALDHQGHGFSDGLPGHIPDIAPVLDDCDAAFRADYPPPLPCFLYRESLGGAIALLLHLHAPGGPLTLRSRRQGRHAHLPTRSGLPRRRLASRRRASPVDLARGEWGIGASLRREVAVPFLSGRFGRGRVKTEAAPLVPLGWGGRTATEPGLAGSSPAKTRAAEQGVRQRPHRLEGDPRGARLQGRPPRRQEGGGQGGGGGRQCAGHQRPAQQGEGGQERQVAPRRAQQRPVHEVLPPAGGRQGGAGEGRAGERRAHGHRAQGRGQEAGGEEHPDLRLRLTSAGYLRGVSMRTWRAGGRPRRGTLRTWRAGARACGRGVRPRGRARRLLRSA